MSSPHHYVPMLKGKLGEFHALNHVPPQDRHRITPFIDVVPPKEGRETRPTVRKQIQQTVRAWGEGGPAYVDMRMLLEKVGTGPAANAMELAALTATEHEFPIIPVTGPFRERQYQEAVRTAASVLGEGVCFRLTENDFDRPGLGDTLADLLALFEKHPSRADVVVDLGYLQSNNERRALLLARDLLDTLPMGGVWRSVTLAGTAFPINLSEFKGAPIEGRIPRVEWAVWQRIAETGTSGGWTPQYGDYGISHPDIADLPDSAGANVPVAVRYTLHRDTLILKETPTPKADAYQRLARRLIGHPDFMGKDYSWGDERAHDVATNPARSSDPEEKLGFGNATMWRSIGTSHHIAVVTEQLRGR